MSDLISREAVLKEMDERHKNGDAITKGFIKKLPPAEPQEWISVKKHGNPKESGVYWVTVTETPFGRNLVFAYAYDVNSKKWANGHIGNEKVIAWMKRNVPSPYKGDES